MQFEVALWIELMAAALGGLQGALFASGLQDRRIDVLGVTVIGLTVALGGSLLRDVILGQQPVVIWVNWYLVTAFAASLVGMVMQPAFAHVNWFIVVLDALVMGLFAAIGASKALSLGVGGAGALSVGIVGAIGGGVLRDLMLDRPISVLHVGTLYAVAAGAGAGTLILLVEIAAPLPVAGAAATVVAAIVRLVAVKFDWKFPEQRSLVPTRARPPTRRRRTHR